MMDTLYTSTSAQEQDFYGDSLILLEGTITEFLSCMDMVRRYRQYCTGHDPICSWQARIKSAASMRAKLLKNHLEPTRENALFQIHDASGVRLVCPLSEDVYQTVRLIREIPGIDIRQEKDYIAHPKPNGYRSYHMILQIPLRFLGSASNLRLPCLEVQVRTIAMDCWASIEHDLKYKKAIPHPELMVQELKRCSEEIASTDLSLSTLKELVASAKEPALSEESNEKECQGGTFHANFDR